MTLPADTAPERGRPERGGHAWNCLAGDSYLPCTCPVNNYHQRWEDVPPEPAARIVSEAAATVREALHLLGPDPVEDIAALHEGQMNGYEALDLLVEQAERAASLQDALEEIAGFPLGDGRSQSRARAALAAGSEDET